MRSGIHIRTLSCFATLAAAVAFAPPAPCQQPSPVAAQPIGYKDPEVATLLSVLVPGGGQIYAGRTGKGVSLLVVGYGSLLAGSILSLRTDCTGQLIDGTFQCSSSTTPLWVGLGVYTTTWIIGWATASDDARARDAELQRATLRPYFERRNGHTELGFSVGLR